MISNAQKYGKKEQEKQFTSMLKLFNPSFARSSADKKNVRVAVTSFSVINL